MTSNSLWVWLAAGAITIISLLPLFRMWGQRASILKNGKAAKINILKVSQTNRWVNNNPVLRLKLELLVEGRAPKALEVEKAVPVLVVAQFQPGAKFNVLANTDDTDIVFAEPWAPKFG